jgi:peroxin-5
MYNVGVACLNLGALKEAAEHFLTGLSLQGQDGDGLGKETKRSEQLWATLRRTLVAMVSTRDQFDEGVLISF